MSTQSQRKKRNLVVFGFLVLTLLVGNIALSSDAWARHKYYWFFAKHFMALPINMFNENPNMQSYIGVDIGTDD
ncbi:MAG: hypothetical protein GKS05_04285 [Nitrospirales bacterium]|nr:hypothetical protein [Nitrospirales bacterium]